MNISDPPFDVHRAILAVVLSWFLSQLLKVMRGMKRKQRFNFHWLWDAGGMPSSHSATVSALTVCTGLYFGFVSMAFMIVLIFSLITMFDAAGVRRSVGKQASVLNKMLEDVSKTGGVAETRLKELLGHTPVEVFAGAMLGIVIAMVFCGF